MKRDYHRWYSPSLRRDMELLVLGHAGARVLIFPTSKGRFFEWEDRGVTQALGEQLETGWLQLICVDSVDAESWYAWHKHPAERAWRQEEYDRYLIGEVIPLSRSINPNPFLMTVGASFGAYHAMDFGLRHPWTVNRIIGMSGMYEIDRWRDGYHNETIHFHNPSAFIAHESDPNRLEAHRRQQIIIAVGDADPLRSSSEYLSKVLWEKGIWNALRIWDGWAHDWPWWFQMLGIYVNGPD